ncbi:IS110 family transposase [Ensifer sp. MPMI2T]|nr:IS110 family transposase [Ensifer sp. MPMI2T]
MKDTMIGVDLAKSVFVLHGASMRGQVKFRKKLSRSQFLTFMADQSPAIVVMESCGSANYWARQMMELGHTVRLIAPQYVRPFVKRQKNDAADAEAIVIAAQRPEMRFVEPKSELQQAKAVLFRARERLVHQRTELVNALRAVLYEYGHTIPQGIAHLKRIEALLDESNSDLPGLVREECRDLLAQICEKTARIEAKMKRIKVVAAETDATRRLQTMPGVGPITALAVEAFAPAMASFKRGRDFAAWLGRKSIPEGSWLARMLGRKPKMLVAIALANKMARAIWAMLTKKEDYRDPALATAA